MCVCMYIYVCIYVCVYVCMYVYVCVCIYVCIGMYACMYVCIMYFYAYIQSNPVKMASECNGTKFSSLLITTLRPSVITTLVYKPLHNVIIELDCVYIFSNIFSCETNKNYMETRLYNDVGGKCFNDPEYYLVAVIA